MCGRLLQRRGCSVAVTARGCLKIVQIYHSYYPLHTAVYTVFNLASIIPCGQYLKCRPGEPTLPPPLQAATRSAHPPPAPPPHNPPPASRRMPPPQKNAAAAASADEQTTSTTLFEFDSR